MHCKSLKELDLRNNSISLLPKKVCGMSILNRLDLSRNLLKALPVEFCEVLESVEDVKLDSNPWSDLPPKWGKLWEGKHATDFFNNPEPIEDEANGMGAWGGNVTRVRQDAPKLSPFQAFLRDSSESSYNKPESAPTSSKSPGTATATATAASPRSPPPTPTQSRRRPDARWAVKARPREIGVAVRGPAHAPLRSSSYLCLCSPW